MVQTKPKITPPPAELEALEQHVAKVRALQSQAGRPAPIVARLATPPQTDFVGEYHQLRLQIERLHSLVGNAAMKACRYRVGAMCEPWEGLEVQKRMLRERGNHLRSFVFAAVDSVDRANLRETPEIVTVAEKLCVFAREAFEELAAAQDAIAFEPRDMDHQLF